MNDISILVLKTQELNPSSQKADQTLQTSPGPANPLNHRLESVNYSAIRQPATENPPKTTQVTQSGQETTHSLNCKTKLTSYSETRQPPKDNSPNVHQIDVNLEPPKTQTYAEVAACLKEVKTKPIFNLANNHQQLPVSRPEGVVQFDYSEQAQPGSVAIETPSQDPRPASALSANPNPAKIKEAKSQGIKTLATTRPPHSPETNLLNCPRHYTVPREPPLDLCILLNTPNLAYSEYNLETILIADPLARTRETKYIGQEGKWYKRPPRLFKDKYNYLPAYFVPMTPPLTVTVSSIMLGIVRPSKKAQKAGKPVLKLTKLTDLNQMVN
ncbi:hypothetical protein DSO57_1010747 [Entomophthora muscae]|uniref:Uncharacterized protein n=1 Tax=Entomophthora muscae TaxID=34485 RepID=A0ACC2THB5_9FUNG|nr:hypothetical protein DSO57_1010747 [Entomophthora muscae]